MAVPNLNTRDNFISPQTFFDLLYEYLKGKRLNYYDSWFLYNTEMFLNPRKVKEVKVSISF